ncbi:cell division protein ZapE [Rhizobium aquaticum]|uniref:Cell division protein ZapE n=1 Tax=Rhizobium aquaticum TaxID=1549636 RepID=A0ABV2J125_9HYPH
MEQIPDYAHSVGERLNLLVEAGKLQADNAQMAVADALDAILSDLRTVHVSNKSSALGWLFAKKRKPANKINGLYVYGQVGRGKTMLMDMFFELAPIQKKRRAHFHEFMADVHERIFKHRQKLKNGETKQADPVPPVAQALRDEAMLLCFDEFTVTDIADAMILSRLFTELFSLGCVLVATSNVEPDNLYPDGLNRGLFVPFIGLLKENVRVMSLDARTDYRLEKTRRLPVFCQPLNAQADAAIEEAWSVVTEGKPVMVEEIPMKGRSIRVPAAAAGAARFTFSDLCEKPLGASDFLAIAERYDTVFVEHIPFMGPQNRNETKRFIILIDALYDHGVRLFASAAAEPEKLLTEKRGTEGFEFDRTASRLFEMQSEDYIAQYVRKAG